MKNCGESYARGIALRRALGNFNFNPSPAFDGVELEWRQRKFCQDQHEYEGQWSVEKGERHGRGIALLRWGYLYEGYWKDNKMHGRGRLIMSTGTYYMGEFKNDKREGTGILITNKGKKYEGEH